MKLLFKKGDLVETPYGLGIVMDVRYIVGTKFQINKRNKIDYLIDFRKTINKAYIDWYEDYSIKNARLLRSDEAIDLNGNIKRVKKVSIYNDITHLYDDFYLFYDEDEVYHLESKRKNKIIVTFSADSKKLAENLAQRYTSKY